MGRGLHRKYSLEFKQQVVELAHRSGISKAAQQLGVSVANVQRWKSEAKRKGEMPVKQNETIEEEVRRLRKENEELKTVNHILKRAAAFFSQDQLK